MSFGKNGVVEFGGSPNPNLLRGTSFSARENIASDFGANDTTWTRYVRYYNGNINNHSFSGDTDTVLLNAVANLGVSFQRKATDINLDSTAYYTLSCEAKCTKASASMCIGTSYRNNSDGWVWRGGANPQAFTSTTEWQKFKWTFKPDADTQYIDYCFTVVGVNGGTDTLMLRHCKLEKGTIPTLWIPNESDVDYTGDLSFIENADNCKIQKLDYIQSNEFIEY